MKNVLWLATNREKRVANIFGPLQMAVSKIANVDFIYRELELMPKQWQEVYTKGNRKPKKLLNVKKANEYDFIMVDAPFAFLDERWDKITTKKGVLIEDQHGDVLNYSKRYVEHGFDIFFTRYKNILKQHPHLSNQNIKWLPHCIDPYIFNDFGNAKVYNSIMIGRTQKNVYPVRWNIHEQMKKHAVNFNYRKIDRPDESTLMHLRWPVGDEYVKLINSSKITFTCMSKFNYVTLKYFEIPACGSVLFADHNNELSELGFEPDKNMVHLNKNDNVPKLVNKWITSPYELDKLSRNGYDLIHERHTAAQRAKQFIEYIED